MISCFCSNRGSLNFHAFAISSKTAYFNVRVHTVYHDSNLLFALGILFLILFNVYLIAQQVIRDSAEIIQSAIVIKR